MDALHIALLDIIAQLKEENQAFKARVSDLETQVCLLNKALYGQKSEKSCKREDKKNIVDPPNETVG